MAEELTIICTGDLHLGRHPARIPGDIDGVEFSPKTVWRETVETALSHDADAVLISGDVIDQENSYFEAYGPFEDGVTRLDRAGIETIVVSGNHDSDLLPQLVSNLDCVGVCCLGEGGSWDRHTITQDGAPVIHVDGWSFPHEHVRQSPLEEYEFEAAEMPVLGLLHADLDAPESEYAPVTRSELEATPADAWLLGHIHAPAVRIETEPTVFYPGSPQPLDPGEPGAHGPWMLRCGTSAGIEIEQVPLATVRYDEVEVDVTDLEDPRDLPGAVTASVDEYVTENVETGALRLLSTRIKLVGETPVHGALVRQRETLEGDLGFRAGGIQVRVDRLDIDTRPAADLEELATEETPVGYLAGLLLDLESGDEPGDLDGSLFGEATDAVREAQSAGAYTPLRRAGRLSGMETDADHTTDVLRRQARLLLHELLEQTEDEP